MLLLPRGNPVKENINPGKLNLAGALDKMRQGKFTGYLRFDFPVGAGVFVCQEGRLISALLEGEHEKQVAEDAISKTFHESLLGQGVMNVYRLSSELAHNIHAFLHGEMLYKGLDLQLTNIKSLLVRMRGEQRSGGLRIYSEQHVALILYKNGNPLGFFHDGAADIVTTADNSMSVAKEPGAKVDVLVNRPVSDKPQVDLMETTDIEALWNNAVGERRDRLKEHETASKPLGIREAGRS
jgi:hypothetical protein